MFWFASVLLAVGSVGATTFLAWQEWVEPRRTTGRGDITRDAANRRVWIAAWAGTSAAAGLACSEAYPGTFYVEKALTRLAMPTGLVWLALLGLCGWLAYCRRWVGFGIAAAVAVAFTAAANPVVASLAARSLERQYDRDPFRAGEFDAVCVLGGGVSLDRFDAPAVNASGQRAILAARLFHAGRTPLLVAAGTAPPGSACPGPGEVTRDLWTGLAIPANSVRLIEGTTTSEELASLAATAAGAEAAGRPWGRIGLVSSAWHLPRAMRLAGAAGLLDKPGCEIVPLPADHLGRLSTTTPHWLPESEALAATDRCLREWLAGWASR